MALGDVFDTAGSQEPKGKHPRPAQPAGPTADNQDATSPGHPPPSAGRQVVPMSSSLPTPHEPYAHRSPYAALGPETAFDLHALLLEYWRIVYRRKWLILSTVIACMVIGLARTLMQVPLYSATTRLQIDRTASRLVDSNQPSGASEADAYDYLKTQFELLQGRAVAERVVASLRLGEDTSFLKPRNASLTGWLRGFASKEAESDPAAEATKSNQSDAAAALVMSNRQIKPVQGARLVDISFTDPNPGRAQAISMAIGQAYIAINLDKRFEANSYAKTFLEDQLKQLKVRLEAADKALVDFSEREQIVIVTEKSSIAENNLAAANAALGALVSERIKNEQLWKQVDGADAISLPQFLTNPVVAGFRDRRNALVTEYQEKLQTFKPGYPAMLEISQKIKEIDRQLANEVTTLKRSLKAGYQNSLNQEEEMKQRIETLRAEVLELQKRSLQYNLLKREVDSTKSIYDGLLQRYKEADVAGGLGTNNIFIVDRPQLPSSPSSPNLPRSLMLASVFGLGLGVLIAYVLSRLDDTYVSADEVERSTGLTILGVVPNAVADDGAEAELSDPQSAISESYRSLCTALQFTTERGLPRSLALTSGAPSEGKSLTAIAIARHFATIGLRVLLLDADMRNPSLHKKLGVANNQGLSNYLTGACTPPEAFQTTALRNLTFMCAGPLPPNAADLLSGARFSSLLSVGSEVFDFIVVDGPPVMEIADAPILTSTVAATIMIVAAGQSRPAMVRGALRRLQTARGPVIGAVLTKFNARVAGYGYGGLYAYRYGGDGYTYGAKGSAEAAAKPLPATAA